MPPLLEIREVRYRYSREQPWILDGISMSFEAGHVYCILGENGSGKTTLLLVMAGLLEPSEGEVLLEGKPLREQLPSARRRIGILFQNPEVMLFNPTVLDEIAYGPRQLFPEDEARKRAVETAKRLGIEGLLNRPTTSLSFGEKKIVALASILSYDPDIVLLDEPLSNLHPSRKKRVLETISDLAGEGKLVVVTSPDENVLPSKCSSKSILRRGKIITVPGGHG
ncbi:MAG: energy-coupling factor ABC transporter ATP-binding protein [Desulfurococcales archaeon]|nr:energy-coupling factor ABC transporter ATP-binding protein [Desulfurococcales archaeon]